MFPEFISIFFTVWVVLATAAMIFLTFFLDERHPYIRKTVPTIVVAIVASTMAAFALVWIAWIVSNWDGRPTGFTFFITIAITTLWLIAAKIGKKVGKKV
jgi:hypothetical protein